VSDPAKKPDDRDAHDRRLLKEALIILLVIIIGVVVVTWCQGVRRAPQSDERNCPPSVCDKAGRLA
jgi:hypothetical protein